MNTEQLQALAQRVRESDKEAFAQLFDHLWEAMEHFSTGLLDDPDTAKDVLQDLWMDYWNRRREIEAGNIKAYLFSALRYRCYKHIRDNKLTPLQEEVVEGLELEESAYTTNGELHRRLQALEVSMKKLPERCREVLILSRFNGLTNEEIARSMQISKKTVENQISNALHRLRKDLHNLSSILSTLF